jgi:hypothetical protein
MRAALFSSLLFTAFAMAAAFAHAFELPNKMRLSAEEYLTVQQIYRGWSLLGIVVFGALLSTFILTVTARGTALFRYALIAFLCILGTQVIFWTLTFPVNQQTRNWTFLPENWTALRDRWEYSHAAGAVLDLGAMVSLILAALVRRG